MSSPKDEMCIDVLLSRRSIRLFKEEDVPLDIVLKAIDVARYAPSAKNSQPWRFYVFKRRDVIERLSEIHSHALPLKKSKIAVVVTAIPSLSPTSYLIDAALAALYLWLALTCFGLGAVWIQALRNVDDIRSIVGIPEEEIPVAILAIGWPAESPPPRPRKKLEEVVKIVE